MGCSTSKPDEEGVVQLCKDRKRFVKQAVEQRTRFASGHIAYIRSLKRVSAALREYVEGDEPRKMLLDSSCITPPFKKGSARFISVSSKSSSPNSAIQSKPTLEVNYLRSGGAAPLSIEERPQPPETNSRVETYSPVHHLGIDGFSAMQSSPNPSNFSYSPNYRPSIPPPSPQPSHRDSFWNPFSSLDYYGYPTRSSLDHTVMFDEISGLRQVREEEGIPDLEEDETEEEETESIENVVEERTKIDSNSCGEEVLAEDDDEDEEDNEEDTESGSENEHEVKDLQSQGRASIGISRAQTDARVEVSQDEMAVDTAEATKETPGFAVHANRRPTNMAEVINDLEAQFMKVCDAANIISALLEATKSQYATPSNEFSATKMLNPMTLLRSASSLSTSSRFLTGSSSTKEDGFESGTDFSDESCMFNGSHQATLDRLYVWEKKLYEEVRSGEKVRIAYERKYKQLRNHDVKGDDPYEVDKTRMALRNLDNQIKVSLQSVETISKRIETLRDEELQPQLMDLLQGFAMMWKEMAECHQAQKRTLDEAKILLAGTPKLEARRRSSISVTEPQARSAANLESELRNWRACFESWIASQRSYLQALTCWLLRCLRFEPDTSKLPFSPRRSNGTLPVFGLCIKWSRFLDAIHEMPVLDGLDFCAAGMGSLHAQQVRDDSPHVPIGSKRFSEESPGKMDLVEVRQGGEAMTAEKQAEFAVWVLCAGLSVAITSLSEFSTGSAEGYAELVNQWANVI